MVPCELSLKGYSSRGLGFDKRSQEDLDEGSSEISWDAPDNASCKTCGEETIV